MSHIMRMGRCRCSRRTRWAVRMSRESWPVLDDEQILDRGPTDLELERRVARRLLLRDTDETTRTLLFRATLVHGAFDRETALGLGSTSPVVAARTGPRPPGRAVDRAGSGSKAQGLPAASECGRRGVIVRSVPGDPSGDRAQSARAGNNFGSRRRRCCIMHCAVATAEQFPVSPLLSSARVAELAILASGRTTTRAFRRSDARRLFRAPPRHLHLLQSGREER